MMASMHLFISRTLITITLVFALIGQALAFSKMACDSTTHEHEAPASLDSKSRPHSNHGAMTFDAIAHSAMEHQTAVDKKCCGIDCSCSANACSSTMLLLTHFSSEANYLSADKIRLHLFSLHQSEITSPYRPPIFT